MTLAHRTEIASGTKADPVTLEILKNALESLADEMALVLLRSAYSPIVRDSMDYSTAICDAKGRIIAQGLTNPIHLGSFPRIMQNLLARFDGEIVEGDGFLVNDPYDAGGMHLPDIFFIRPVFASGRLVGFTSALVHHTDIGGMSPGSMALHAEEIFQEGLRLPLIRLYEAGRPVQSVFDIITANSRMPDEVLGDLRAQISACDIVAKSFAKLACKHGAAFEDLIEELHDYAERLVRQRLIAMPDGTYIGEDYIDGLGHDGTRIDFRVAITISGANIHFDWTGTSGQVRGAINCPITTTWSLAYAALRNVLGQGIPNCEGYMRALTLSAPEGTIVNPYRNAACAARGVIAYRMLDTSFAALSKMQPGLAPAGGEGGPTAITFSGPTGQGGRWLVTDGILGSWGGRAQFDGPEGISSPGANLSNQPIELMEARLPLRVEAYGYAPNSGGAGRTRGGQAMLRSYVIEGEGTTMTLRSDRRKNLPLPIEGGLAGSPSLTILETASGTRALLPTMAMAQQPFGMGDRLIHIAAGGAGYGDPLLRDPAQVREDVLDDFIDPGFAAEVYGVVFTPDLLVDRAATEAMRAKLADVPLAERQKAQTALFAARNGASQLMEA